MFINNVLGEELNGAPAFYNSNILGRYMKKKTIMENCPMNLQDQIIMTIEWAGERMEQLNQEGRLNDLYCIYEEFYEWIEQSSEEEILALDSQGPS